LTSEIADADYNAAMRLYAAVGAVLGWFALVLQLWLMLARVAGVAAMLQEAITFFSFFTILTNILVALVFTAMACGWVSDFKQFFNSSSVQAAIAVYIAMVGISYHLLLAQLWNPQGAQWLADTLLHTVMPVAYVLYWVIFGPRAGLRWKDAAVWLIYPGVYLGYVLAKGAVSGVYPYPFVDVKVLGYGGVFVRAGVFLLVFLGLGLLAVALGRNSRGLSKA
jgi:hypothetical protein